MPKIAERNDEFHSNYWDVFHAAAQETTIEGLEEKVSEAITEARSHLADAWNITVDDRMVRLEQGIKKAAGTVASPLTRTRELLRGAKSRQANAGRLIRKESYLEATEELRGCLEDCTAAESELDDALRAHQKQVRESKWLRAGTIAVIVTATVAAATYIGYLLGTQQGSPPLP